MHKKTTSWLRLLGYVMILLAAAGCFQQAGEGSLQTPPISQALPTDTPLPTNTVPPPTPVPTDTLEPTIDIATLGQGGAETPSELAILPTFTSVPAVVAQAQDDQLSLEQTATTEYLLNTQPLYVTATAFILGATQTVEAQLTGTQVQVIPPTATPPPTLASSGGTTPVVSGADCIHEVRAEDRNLYRISLRYGTTVRAIAQASGITNINLITIGERLVIPGCGTLGVTPPPTSTPQANETPVAGGGTGSPSTGRIHIVEQGETLFEISMLYSVPVNTIAAANGISNINLIYIGQELVIP